MLTNLIPTLVLFAVTCSAAEIDPKGIFISSGSSAPAANESGAPAVRLQIELNRNGAFTPVAATYRFQSGDRFHLSLELSRPGHVYVVNRSIEGNPEGLRELLGTRGINVVSNQTAASPNAVPKFQVLWPPAGADSPLPARQVRSIPGQNQFFEFDANPGIEKISVIVSPYALDVSKYFSGLSAAPKPPAGSAPAAHRDDTNAEVLAQLEDLRSLDGNAVTDAGGSRGICVGDCSQYSAPVQPARPFIVTVDLLHSRVP